MVSAESVRVFRILTLEWHRRNLYFKLLNRGTEVALSSYSYVHCAGVKWSAGFTDFEVTMYAQSNGNVYRLTIKSFSSSFLVKSVKSNRKLCTHHAWLSPLRTSCFMREDVH